MSGVQQKKRRSVADRKQVEALADSYRRFAAALGAYRDFSTFFGALGEAVRKDPVLAGSLASLAGDGDEEETRADVFVEGQVVLPVDERAGYLRVEGRRDGKAFGPEDLHLMGALAEFVSALVRQVRDGARARQAVATLRFILDQLPLGVVCFGADRALLAANRAAAGLTGGLEDTALADLFLGKQRGKLPEQARFHFEAEGRLVFAEGRRVEDGDAAGAVFLLYDMGSRRDRLLAELDKQSYRARCLGSPCTAAFLQSEKRPGAAYAAVKRQARELQVPPEAVQPLDAYTCGCVFAGRDARSVRFLLQCHAAGFGLDDLRVAVVAPETEADRSDSPGAALLEAGKRALAPAAQALRPQVACLEAYAPVAETLALLLEEVCRLRPVADLDALLGLMDASAVDGVFFDLDGHDAQSLGRLRGYVAGAGEGFKVFYSSYAQPDMARARYGLAPGDTVLQKPFDAESLAQAVHLQFNLA